MFDLRRNDMTLGLQSKCLREAANRKIAGFGSTRREDYFVRSAVDKRSQLVSGLIDRGPGFLPEMVNARRVAEFRGQIRHHGVDDFRIDGRGSGIVQINSLEHS